MLFDNLLDNYFFFNRKSESFQAKTLDNNCTVIYIENFDVIISN